MTARSRAAGRRAAAVPPAGRVLSVASEFAPLVKTGGLADVVGALPAALAAEGWESRVLLPGYRLLRERVTTTAEVWHDPDLFGGPAVIRLGSHDGVSLLLLDAPHLFDRDGGPYGDAYGDFGDNHVRFAALSWAAARLALGEGVDGWHPQVVHAHDWHAALVPSYLRYAGADVPTVLTIHNIAFQGVTDADQLDRLRLPAWDFHPDSLEYHGRFSALKAGMLHATHVTTVSPTYAEELTDPQFGFGLEGVVGKRRNRGEFTGILNGIDTAAWDPATDPHIITYSAEALEGRAANRAALQAEFGLIPAQGPIAAVVTRLTYQKGVDLLLAALPAFLEAGGAAVILGSGEPEYEDGLRDLARRFPDRVGVRIGYDEALSHRLYAGADLVLVPSRFEPCGLTQLYGLRYGAVPLVAATGGLRDTVTDASAEHLADGRATGFTYTGGEQELRDTLLRAVALFADQPTWGVVREQGMRTPVGWSTSARRYASLFRDLVR